MRTEKSDKSQPTGVSASEVVGEDHLGAFLGLALLLLLALAGGLVACLLLVDDEASVALFAVPLEATEVGCVELVVSLEN